ncbi:hypothetical protein [Streptomyces sp. NPDC051636]|uniref:hypothetical protein n=1 Tax=Streptomyces sp. NPDC051636 TaxID=3365663 RepID=UPI0037AB44D9
MSRWTENRIVAEPATVQACQADRRTAPEQAAAEGAARGQLADTRQHAAESAAAPGSRRN